MLCNTHGSGDARVKLMFIKVFESLGWEVQILFLIVFAGYSDGRILLSPSENMVVQYSVTLWN